MRVLILCDGAALDPSGALHAQVRAAAGALGREAGVQVRLAGRETVGLPPCDVVHVLGAAGAGAALAAARALQVPVVLSPRLSSAWSSANGTRARVADRVQGNRSACDLDSGYARIRRALAEARLVVTQSDAERRAVNRAFLLAGERIRVVPPGIGASFFDTDPGLFRRHAHIAGRFALMVGRVSPYAGQLDVACALAALALPLVVIGEVRERDASYERELRAQRTVTCLGELAYGDPLLASACAAASVFIHAGRSAGWPMAAAEALAAGTPVVTTGGCDLPLADPGLALRHAGCGDAPGLQAAVSELLERAPVRTAVSALVRPFTWERAASQLAACYREALESSS